MTKPFTLYYAPAVCSLVPAILLQELGEPFELIRVDLRSHRTADGTALAEISAKDCVPVLRLPDGAILTETAVIALYLADQRSELGLAPLPASPARVRCHELLNLFATDIHKGFAPFTIMPNPSDEIRRWAARRLTASVAVVETALGDQPYLAGDAFTVVDAYAYWALTTYRHLLAVALSDRLASYVERVGQRPSVQAAVAKHR